MKFFILVTFYIATVKAQILNQKLKEEEKLNKVILPPCAACSVVVNSISSLVNKDDKTDFGNVKFKICTDITRGTLQCQANVVKWSEYLSKWVDELRQVTHVQLAFCRSVNKQLSIIRNVNNCRFSKWK